MIVDWNKEPEWAEHKGIDVVMGIPVTWGNGRYQYEGGDVCHVQQLPYFFRTHSRPEPLEC